MNEKEFMELLDYYFRDVDGFIYNEIKFDYEEHFRMGVSEGKTEEEISRSLGSPKEIYEEFKDEGIFDENKKGNFFEGINGDFFTDIADRIGNIFTKKEKKEKRTDLVIENKKIDTPIHRLEVKVANTDVYIENHDEDYIEVTHSAIDKSYDFTVLKEGTTLKVGTYDYSKFDMNKYFSFGFNSPVQEIYIKIPIGNEANISINSETGNSKVYVNNNNINYFSASGDLDLESKGSILKVTTAAGDINVKGIRNSINVNNVSGETNIESESPEINIDTVSGGFNFEIESSNNISVNTAAGNVNGIIKNLNAAVDISTISGDITFNTAFGIKNNIVKSYKDIIGTGYSKLKIRTVSGSIKIKTDN